MKNRLRFTLTYNGIDSILQDSPDGWEDELLNFERSKSYHGIFRSGSLNLRFVGDGALMLRKAFYTDGIAADVTLKIEALNILNLTYDTLLSGAEFDFKEFNDQPYFVEVPVIQGGLQRIIDANITKEVTLPIATSQILRYDGVKLYAGTAINTKTTYTSGDAGYLHLNQIVPQIKDPAPTDNTQGAFTLTTVNETINNWYGTPSLFDFFKANRDGSAIFTIYAADVSFTPAILKGDYNGGTEQDRCYMRMYLHRFSSADVELEQWQVKEYTGIPIQLTDGFYMNQFGGSLNYTSSEIAYNDGDYFCFSWRTYFTDPNQLPNCFTVHSITGLSLQIDVATTLPLIDINCRTAKELITLLLAEIEPTATFASTFLDGLPTNEQPLFVSGDSIRGITDTTFRTSIAEVVKALSNRYCLGLTVDGTTLRLEEMSYFYDADTLCMDVGEVRNLNVQVANDLYYGSVVVGWPNQEYNELNGRDEFNATQTWKIPLDIIEAQESRIGSIRADMYGIDFLRITYNGDSSTDTKEDNQLFMVDGELVSPGVYKVSRDKFTSISGLINDVTAYNINYSPKRCLLAWGALIRSFVSTGSLTLSAYDKNINLAATGGGVALIENTPVLVSSLDAALFKPVIFTFEFPQMMGTFPLINAQPFGYIQFTWEGNTYKGFIQSASIQEARNGILSYTLIAHPDTVLTTLIRK